MSQHRKSLSHSFARLSLEALEERRVLSTLLGSHHGHAPAALVAAAQAQSTEVHLVGSLASSDSASQASGYVKFESETEHGVTKAELEIRVRGLTPNASVDVNIDSTMVGKIQTDATGAGKLVLHTVGKANPSLPDLSTVAAGSIVMVGDTLTATLAAAPAHSSSDSEGSEQPETHLSAKLSGVDGTSTIQGSVEYESETEHGLVVSKFKVSVSHAAPNTTLDVQIDGVSVGSITVDSKGRGHLVFSTNPQAGKSQAFPANFPAIKDGSVVSVGGLAVGTLTTCSH